MTRKRSSRFHPAKTHVCTVSANQRNTCTHKNTSLPDHCFPVTFFLSVCGKSKLLFPPDLSRVVTGKIDIRSIMDIHYRDARRSSAERNSAAQVSDSAMSTPSPLLPSLFGAFLHSLPHLVTSVCCGYTTLTTTAVLCIKYPAFSRM